MAIVNQTKIKEYIVKLTFSESCGHSATREKFGNPGSSLVFFLGLNKKASGKY